MSGWGMCKSRLLYPIISGVRVVQRDLGFLYNFPNLLCNELIIWTSNLNSLLDSDLNYHPQFLDSKETALKKQNKEPTFSHSTVLPPITVALMSVSPAVL